MSDRIKSLDILRGLDMFVLAILTSWLMKCCCCFDWLSFLKPQLEHPTFGEPHMNCHDLIMPLFLFCSGTAIPFAFTKYREQGRSSSRIYLRIIRRFIILWILGMIFNGKLLTYNPELIKFFSNTLQSIAIGYAVSAILFLNTRIKTQIIVAASLLAGYWVLLTFVSVDGFGGGDYGQNNLCEWVDRVVLGKHCDHAILNQDGSWYFESAGYTWILSSLNFIVTVMTGMFAGEILIKKSSEQKKVRTMFGIGSGMLVIGEIWGLQMPINKYIWSSTMTLTSSGICFLLLAIIYYMVDYRKWKGLDWLIPVGMNAIFIYMLPKIIPAYCITDTLTKGLEQYFSHPEFFALFRGTVHSIILYLLLVFMYKKKIFIRV